MAEPIVYLNGEFISIHQAHVSVLDRGFLFADGVYEVIPVYGRQLFRIDEHLKRLEYSLEACRISNPHTRVEWKALFNQLIEKQEVDNLSLYCQVTRGADVKRDHRFGEAHQPTVLAMVNRLPASNKDTLIEGIRAVTVEDIRWARCDIKATSLLANVLMRQHAEDLGAQEAIVLKDGRAIEGSTSNLFIVRDGKLITPPKSHQILGGITRQLILELAQKHGLPWFETDITLADLQSADEVWLSSSTKEIRPVIELDGKPVNGGAVGPVVRAMIDWYQDFKANYRGN